MSLVTKIIFHPIPIDTYLQESTWWPDGLFSGYCVCLSCGGLWVHAKGGTHQSPQ